MGGFCVRNFGTGPVLGVVLSQPACLLEHLCVQARVAPGRVSTLALPKWPF